MVISRAYVGTKKKKTERKKKDREREPHPLDPLLRLSFFLSFCASVRRRRVPAGLGPNRHGLARAARVPGPALNFVVSPPRRLLVILKPIKRTSVGTAEDKRFSRWRRRVNMSCIIADRGKNISQRHRVCGQGKKGETIGMACCHPPSICFVF